LTYGDLVNDRVTSRQRSDAGPALLTKPAKRAAAKAARERAAARARLRRRLTTTAIVVAVLAVITAGVVFAVRAIGSGTDNGAAATPSTATTADAALPFPGVPADADPALKTKPVVKAGSGALTNLWKTTLIEGKGPATQTGQTITVNYVGVTYADGKEFDSSWNSSATLPFTLGAGNVITGWDQGLVGIKVGSRVQLDLPANLAYGDHPTGGQPAGALRFVVDILSAQ
jgi:peptidylprolyl isomerase